MHQIKKGNQWCFGVKLHAGVDKDSGLIHSLAVTPDNVHDLTPVAKLCIETRQWFMARPAIRASQSDRLWQSRQWNSG